MKTTCERDPERDNPEYGERLTPLPVFRDNPAAQD